MSAAFAASRGRARIGVVVPVTNTNLEPDLAMLAPPGVSLHFSRAGGYDVDAIPDETQMRRYADAPLERVVDDLRLCRAAVVLYGCTSATLAHGPAFDRQFRARISAQSGVPAITAAAALAETLARLDVRRFAFTSPYVASLNDLAIAFLEAGGARCVGRHDAPAALGNDAVAAVTPAQVHDAARRADRDAAEAIVISCTDYRAAEAVPAIEAELDKPVVASNPALLLAGLAALGIEQHATLRDGFRAARAWA